MPLKPSKFWIGTSGWTYQDWAGIFYPENCPQKSWLNYYAHQFNVVELNATFYRSFPKKTYQHWYETVPEQFRYVIKLSRYITHHKYLLNVKTAIRRAENSAHFLEDKLGLILMQLPPRMPYDLSRLHAALSTFQDPTKVVVEFRNPKWLTDESKVLLTDFKAIFCNVDGPHSRIKDWLTGNIAYIRLHGRKQMYKHSYSAAELLEISHHARNLLKKGAKEVYIFFNNDYHGHAPQNAKMLQRLLEDQYK